MCYRFVVFLAVVGSSLAFTAEFIPKSFFVIHSNGERSPVVNFRPKRSLQEPLFPLIPEVRRMRRSTGSGSGSGSGSYSSSYASAGAGAGGGNDAAYFDNFAAGFEQVAKLAGFPNGFPGGFPPGAGGAGYPGGAGGAGYPGGAGGYAGAGYPGGVGGSAGASYPGGVSSAGYGGDAAHGLAAPNLNARFGGDEGVSYSENADGARGVYSASSSSIDSDGNVKYSVKTGKF